MAVHLSAQAAKFIEDQHMGWPEGEAEAAAIERAAGQGERDRAAIEAAIAESIAQTHEKFAVTCLACGSAAVYVANDVTWSECSGSRGSVDLVCNDCGARAELASFDA